ncbi:TonB-dependent receptor [Lacinutrix sp. MEBiC02595]
MKKIKIILVLLLLINFAGYAQKQVGGKVTDQETSQPLLGVNVIVKGTSKGVATDFDGNYSLEVNTNDVLEFIYLGYTTSTLIVSDAADYNVKMEESAQSLGEVLLTSRKKAEYAKDIPISITAIGAKELKKSGSFEFSDYASKVPNLSFGKQGGGGDLADGRTSNSISIRGITGNATTAFYLDEVPLPETVDPKLVDVKQIEVLRGPQGTLYGSSAMGGALKVITNEPTTYAFSGNAGMEVSSVDEGGVNYSGDLTLNIPVVKDKLAVRTVAFYNFKSGIFDKVPLTSQDTPITLLNDNHSLLTKTKEDVDDETTFGFHLGAKWTPTERLTILPKFIYQSTEADGYNLADTKPGNFDQVRFADIDENFEDRFSNLSLTTKYKLDKGEFVLAMSSFDRYYYEKEDFSEWLTYTAFEIPQSDEVGYPVEIWREADFEKFVTEFRYVSDLDGKFNFSSGIFYAKEKSNERGESYSSGLGEFIGETSPEFDYVYEFVNGVEIKEISLFTEMYYEISDKLKATFGLRWFDAESSRSRTVFSSLVSGYEDITGDLPANKASGFNPKFGLKYKFNDNNMMYVSASKGYRLGGVNGVLPAYSESEAVDLLGTINVPATYKDDYLWSYELGAKAGLTNKKLLVNAALFYNDWHNIQQRTNLPVSGYNFIMNIDKAYSYGLEMDVHAYPTSQLTLSGSIGLIKSEITEVGEDAHLTEAEKGDEILLIPDITASATAEYRFKAFNKKDMFVRADLQHSGTRYSNYDRSPARTLDAYTLVNARIGISLNKFDVSLFANNLTNENANFGDIISLAAELEGRTRYATSRPFTAGVSLRAKF